MFLLKIYLKIIFIVWFEFEFDPRYLVSGSAIAHMGPLPLPCQPRMSTHEIQIFRRILTIHLLLILYFAMFEYESNTKIYKSQLQKWSLDYKFISPIVHGL